MYVPGCALSCIYAPFYSMTVAIPAAFRQLSEQARQAQSEREKKKTWPCIHAKIYTGRDMLSAKKELFDFKAGEKNMLIITLETVLLSQVSKQLYFGTNKKSFYPFFFSTVLFLTTSNPWTQAHTSLPYLMIYSLGLGNSVCFFPCNKSDLFCCHN